MEISRYTVRKNIPFCQSLDGNCVDFGVWRYTSSKTWNLSYNSCIYLAQSRILNNLNVAANCWILDTKYTGNLSK